MNNLSTYHTIRFLSGNRWYFTLMCEVNFDSSFITHNSQTYIIQIPTKSIVEIISEIIRRKAL